MTGEYPVKVDIESPQHFERLQLVLRIALAIVLGWVGVTAGWLMCLLFGVLPIIAAITISSRGGPRFFSELAPRLARVLTWLLQLGAFMAIITDRFPAGEDDDVKVEFRFTGTPTVGSALARLVTSIPSGFVLWLLSFVAALLWFFAAIVVLAGAPMPQWILGFQRGMLRWQARLVAYHASFVEEYPPFSFDTEAHPRADDLAASGAR
jgi:hypothetical protein